MGSATVIDIKRKQKRVTKLFRLIMDCIKQPLNVLVVKLIKGNLSRNLKIMKWSPKKKLSKNKIIIKATEILHLERNI